MPVESNPANAGQEPLGVLCLDDSGGVVYSSGLGSDPAVVSLAQDPEWIAGLSRSRISSINLNGLKLILIWCDLARGSMLAIREAPGETVFEFVAAVDFAYDIFEHLLSDPFQGMTVVDKDGVIRFISPIHENFFRHRHGQSVGEPVEEVIENTRLHKILQSGKAEIGHIQRMSGTDRIVSRTPIFSNNEVVGAVGRVMFKSPQQLDELNQRIKSLESEVEFYKREADAMRRQDYGVDSIIGTSPQITALKKDIIRVAPLDVPVLILGESGSGKELVAQSLHRLSSRRAHNMIMVNAAALPATLVESELFGYSPGAFTGANKKGHTGKFEQANKSTLFLDEIGDMPVDVQAKVLRVVQDGCVEKLGGAKPKTADFRLVSATNRDIDEMVERNDFRLDLYYRISPVLLRVPPLRERTEDIPLLATEFLKRFADRHGRHCCTLQPAAVEFLQTQKWPGNVRQLEHELQRAAIFNVDGEIRLGDLEGTHGKTQKAIDQPSGLRSSLHDADFSLKKRVGQVERELIGDALKRYHGNKKKVAEKLEISRSYLYKRMSELGLEVQNADHE